MLIPARSHGVVLGAGRSSIGLSRLVAVELDIVGRG
jgi:hypothetical protein